MRSIFSAVLLVGLAGAARAQDAPAPAGERRAAVTVGFGNDLGWLGAMGEKYFAGGRKSLFAGIGYLPEIDDGEEVSASGPAFAAGVRAYTGGEVHRAFVEASVSAVSYETAPTGFPTGDLSIRYGPGIQVGYQRAARGGFTFVVSSGIGLTLGETHGDSRAAWTAGIGLGKTWRRR
jgi:hypothetical protein